MRKIFALGLALFCADANATADLNPRAVAARAARMIVAHPNYTQPGCTKGCSFTSWGYCGGLVVNGLLDAFPLLPDELQAVVSASTNATLDRWYRTVPAVVDLLANRSIPNGPDLLNSAPAAANFLLHGGASDTGVRLIDRLCDAYFGESYPDHLAGVGPPCRNTTGGGLFNLFCAYCVILSHIYISPFTL